MPMPQMLLDERSEHRPYHTGRRRVKHVGGSKKVLMSKGWGGGGGQ